MIHFSSFVVDTRPRSVTDAGSIHVDFELLQASTAGTKVSQKGRKETSFLSSKNKQDTSHRRTCGVMFWLVTLTW